MWEHESTYSVVQLELDICQCKFVLPVSKNLRIVSGTQIITSGSCDSALSG